MNKYYQLLGKILIDGKTQIGKKGKSRYLLNESLSLAPADLLDIFEGHNIARRKLKDELRLFMSGERQVEKYREAASAGGITVGKRSSTVIPPISRSCRPLSKKSTERSAVVRTMCSSSVPPTRRPTKHRASASYSSSSTAAIW